MQQRIQKHSTPRIILALALILTGWLLALLFPHPATAQPMDPCPSVFLNNGSCDDTSGTGLCAAGTDPFDCSQPGGLTGQPGTASCPYALNGVCDEPHIGTGLCATGTDVADCKGLADQFCPTTMDGICDEPVAGGTGRCPRGTDAGDCIGTGCQSTNNGICDEPVAGGTGLCPRGTDTADCFATGCQSTNNGICDEPGLGTGLCAAGTDVLDCADRTSNNCLLANNGICNEPPNGSGCPRGTDTADCSGRGSSGFGVCVGPDCCTYAFDGQCDEPGIGTGRCAAGTDQSDCKPPEPPKTTKVVPPPGTPQDLIKDCDIFCNQGTVTPAEVQACLKKCYSLWLMPINPQP